MGLKSSVLLFLVLFFGISTTCYAGWSGPQEILSGSWGNNQGQFAIKYGDSGDSFPRAFCVSKGGFIAIADEFNSRIHTYKITGTGIAVYGPQKIPESEGWKLGWPLRIGCFVNSVYTEFDKYTQIYNTNGKLIKSWDSLQGGLANILFDDNFITWTSTKYYLYSSTGKLLKTTTKRPLELGMVKSSLRQADGSYLTIIQYDDMTYSAKAPTKIRHYARDISGNLIAAIRVGSRDTLHYRVYKYDRCGKVLGFADLPANNIISEPDTIPPAPTPRLTIVAEYGEPVIAPNGDVYTWKRTETTYSILKWTWQDDPNVPKDSDCGDKTKKDKKAK